MKNKEKDTQGIEGKCHTVRNKMEEEYWEKWRQQAREVAIAAGSYLDEAERIVMGGQKWGS